MRTFPKQKSLNSTDVIEKTAEVNAPIEESIKPETPPIEEPPQSEAPPIEEPSQSEAPPIEESLKPEATPIEEPPQSEAPPIEESPQSEAPPIEESPQSEAPPATDLKNKFHNYLRPSIAHINQPFKANNIAQIYKFPPPSNRPVTVSLISFGGGLFGNVSSSGVLSGGDVQAYWTSIGIATANQPKVIIVSVDGGVNTPVKDQTETSENTIDVSMVGACCATSNLTIILFIAPNSLSGFPNLILKATSPLTVDGILYTPSVVSISWGAAEIYYSADQLTTINTALLNAANSGINICASTGDEGSSDGVSGGLNYVDFPASSPYVTACGGTNLVCPTLKYSDTTTIETAWSSGGGGISGTFSKPTWQSKISGAIGSKRCLPDIALVADPKTGVEFLIGGTKYVFGGTSIVSPAMAAYYACINTKTFLLPSLYSAYLAAPNSFHDITSGSNGAYTASVGFDLCTGFGSIAGDILTSQLLNQPPPTTIAVTGITVNTSSVTIIVGKQISITALIAPSNATNKSITWVSNNSSIAIVIPVACTASTSCDSVGLITAVSIGSTTVTATTLDGQFRATISVTVIKAPTIIPVTGVSLNVSNLTLVVGSQKQLIATISPSNATNTSVIWSSSSSLATVNSTGLVTAIAIGTVSITVKTVDGNYMATASITVIKAPTIISVTGVSLNLSNVTLVVGSQKQLVATILPSNATNTSVIWSSSSSLATVNSTGLVTAIAIGTVSITVKTVDGNYMATAVITVVNAISTISFIPSSINLYVYSYYQPNLVFNPSSINTMPVIYKSSSPNIAYVYSTGLVITLSPGAAVITATVNGMTATLNINVIANYTYYATQSTDEPIKRKANYRLTYNNQSILMRR